MNIVCRESFALTIPIPSIPQHSSFFREVSLISTLIPQVYFAPVLICSNGPSLGSACSQRRWPNNWLIKYGTCATWLKKKKLSKQITCPAEFAPQHTTFCFYSDEMHLCKIRKINVWRRKRGKKQLAKTFLIVMPHVWNHSEEDNCKNCIFGASHCPQKFPPQHFTSPVVSIAQE